ncbi:MAG: glycosyl hydrolase [Friedmanniella sp.]
MTPPLGIEELRQGFVQPPVGAAPMLRWWWFGPSVQRDELDRELTAMAGAGFGGVEVAYVYPLAAVSSPFLSEGFLSDLRFAADRAHELGLRFDLTLGSGWSFGGPHVTDDLAARRLRWERREIAPGPHRVPVSAAWPGDVLVVAYLGAGSLQEEPAAYTRLPIVDGTIQVPDGTGTRVVLLATSQPTGQNVKRAAVGAEGPVLDHYQAAATRAHLRWAGDRLLDAVPSELVGSVFCDSLEVYEADWTPDLPEEFVRRCGYELLPVLYLLAVDGADASRVRADYHRTLSQLYEENFVAVIQHWAASRGVLFRIQGYGTPPATVSSYRFADLVEGEGWGWKKLTQTRWASSAGHLYGREVVSAEAWTWVHSPSFRATPLDLQGEAHEHLLNGVNQLIGHGWPYSPADAPGLGWFFYAAGALDDRNPWWVAMPKLNESLSRLCWLLRQGRPVADVALYVPNEDLFAGMGLAVGGSLDTWREAARRIGSAVPAAIREAGLDFDLVDDDALGSTPADRYRVVVVPATGTVPPPTARWFEEVPAVGGQVILVDGTLAVPGAVATTADGLASALSVASPPDLALEPPTPDVGFVHRRCADAEVYFLANTGPTPRACTVKPRGDAPTWEEWDPRSGHLLRAGTVAGGIPIVLAPFASTVLVLRTDVGAADRLPAVSTDVASTAGRSRSVLLDRPWQVSFGDGAPEPVRLPHVWETDPGRRHYSGSATYRTDVELDLQPGDRVVLDLGEASAVDQGSSGEVGLVGPSYRAAAQTPVGEVAEVRVNGIHCGVLWAPPYRLDLTPAVRAGSNGIEVTVANTAANALAADEHIGRVAAESEASYGRRFRMQELDRAMDSVRSGLLQVPVVLVTGA